MRVEEVARMNDHTGVFVNCVLDCSLERVGKVLAAYVSPGFVTRTILVD